MGKALTRTLWVVTPALVLAAGVAVTTQPVPWSGVSEWCRLSQQHADATPTWHHAGPTRAAVIGDSWSTGLGGLAWPELVAEDLKLDLRVAAFDGSGYLDGSACGGREFRERVDQVPEDARLVIVAGGLNDTGEDPDELADAVADLLDDVRLQAPSAEVVVLGVPLVEALPDDETGDVDAVLAEVTGEAFVDVRGTEVELLADEIHPTEAGHHEYAALVAAAVGPLLS